MYETDSLAHYGIKGQAWGVRRFQNEDGTLTEAGKQRYGYYLREDGKKDVKRLIKDAENDAREYARAKAYYGDGAGNRRKQIRNKISERMKDPDYKAEFDRQMKNQNMAEHQKAANRERKFNDAKEAVKKTGNGIKNLLLGFGTTSLAAIAIVSMMRATKTDQKIAEWGQQQVSNIANNMQKKKKVTIEDFDWHPNRAASTSSSAYRSAPRTAYSAWKPRQ